MTSAGSDLSGAPDVLGLLRIPGSFTQDQLLRTEDLLREAATLGITIRASDLERLHRSRLLVPLYLLTDEVDPSMRLDSNEPRALNPRGWTFDAAREGKLRLPHVGDVVDEFPYERPDDADRRWWDGYVYSSWQLLELPHALIDEALLPTYKEAARARQQRRRAATVAAAALATRYLPDIVGRVSFPGGVDRDAVWRARYTWTADRRLSAVAVEPEALQREAERLLGWAHDDPMIGWWSVIRHAGHAGWSKITGRPALCIQHRLMAEILLRAHEELAEAGALPPLDTPTGMMRHPLDDRVQPARSGRSLDAELASLGISPHPRVVLLVEGKTERLHAGALAQEFGIDRPHLLRVIDVGGSRVRPDLVARYVATPRLAPAGTAPDQELDAIPTAVMIAMDPENLWRTESDRETRLQAIHNAVRAAVEEQGGRMSQSDLDFLLEVHTWGDQTYEFANFTDEELADAVVLLADVTGSTADRATVQSELAAARGARQDIGVALGRLRLPQDKVRLAQLLTPTLISAVEQVADNQPERPIIRLVDAARQKVMLLLGGTYVLSDPDA